MSYPVVGGDVYWGLKGVLIRLLREPIRVITDKNVYTKEPITPWPDEIIEEFINLAIPLVRGQLKRNIATYIKFSQESGRDERSILCQVLQKMSQPIALPENVVVGISSESIIVYHGNGFYGWKWVRAYWRKNYETPEHVSVFFTKIFAQKLNEYGLAQYAPPLAGIMLNGINMEFLVDQKEVVKVGTFSPGDEVYDINKGLDVINKERSKDGKTTVSYISDLLCYTITPTRITLIQSKTGKRWYKGDEDSEDLIKEVVWRKCSDQLLKEYIDIALHYWCEYLKDESPLISEFLSRLERELTRLLIEKKETLVVLCTEYGVTGLLGNIYNAAKHRAQTSDSISFHCKLTMHIGEDGVYVNGKNVSKGQTTLLGQQ